MRRSSLAWRVPTGVLLASTLGGGTAGAATDKAVPLTYVALGDSSGVGVGGREGGYVAHLHRELIQLRPGLRVENLCRSGATSAGVLADQVPRVPRGNHALVTIGVGVNDLSRQVSPTVFAQRFEAIVEGVRARTNAPLVITNLPDVSMAPVVPAMMQPLVRQLVRSYNQLIASTAARHGAILVDTFTVSRKEIPEHPEFFSEDGFHPSDAGYRFWAGIMLPEVRKLVTSPR